MRVISISIFFLILACSCNNSSTKSNIKSDQVRLNDASLTAKTGTFIDQRDGMIYKTTQIDDRIWMAQNLAYKPATGKFSAYANDTLNIKKYGYMYDAPTACSVCPTGWSLPSYAEWKSVINKFGGYFSAGYPLKDSIGWPQDANGSNASGFSGRPGGWRTPAGDFMGINEITYWWSRTIYIGDWPYAFGVIGDCSTNGGCASIGESTPSPNWQMYVRCIKNSSDTFVDPRDNKKYKTVKIGHQTWLAQNLAYKPSKGNYYAYLNDTNNISKYGYLYDWQTAQNVCPNGWHLPSNADVDTLAYYLGGVNIAGLKMKNSIGWNDNGNGSNSSRFSALPGGRRRIGNIYEYEGFYGYWWLLTQTNYTKAYFYGLNYSHNELTIFHADKRYAMSARYIKD